jgi:hypothetical protein
MNRQGREADQKYQQTKKSTRTFMYMDTRSPRVAQHALLQHEFSKTKITCHL